MFYTRGLVGGAKGGCGGGDGSGDRVLPIGGGVAVLSHG